jgi:3-oxoadipate enol-lactonase
VTGPLDQLVTGAGDPVTVFAHGLGQTIPETRPLGSKVAGTRVFFAFRGHGRSPAPDSPWGYAELARDLRAVADAHGATRAVGASLGAAALCRLLADSPDRFERLVFFLPAVLDEPRRGAVPAESLAGVQPAAIAAYRRLAAEVPLPAGADGLGAVTAPALVLACRGDELHPLPVAERLAAALPRATLHVYDEPDVLGTQRADLRRRISGFLGPIGYSAGGRPQRNSSTSDS